MMRIIEVIVSPTGETKIETRGFTGGECQQASKFLERALGERDTETLTTEFHTQQSTDVSQRQQN